MKKRTLATILTAALLGCSLCACGSDGGSSAATTAAAVAAPAAEGQTEGGNAAAADLPKMTLSIGHNNNSDSLMNYVAEQMKAKLEEKSGGNLTVNIYPSGQLGSESDMVTSCQEGDLTFLISGLHALVNNVPETSIVNLPFMFDNVEQARKTFADETVRKELNAGFEKSNMKLVLLADQGFRCLSTNKEITGPDSFKGLNIRTLTNQDQVEAWKMLGTNPTPIDFSELYLSLQQGVIDSQENPYDIIDTNKFYEVQKYFTNSNHIYHTISVNIGTSTYDSMPAEYQKMIDETCAEVEQMAFDECDKKLDSYKNNLINNGMEFIDFDEIDGMREALAERTSGMIDIVKNTVNNEVLVDAFLAAAEAAKAE
ncbi:MAG: TRAP transporter substrate-binding protein [Lachnospiraceae bacterium]|nr:TRAP transporter substrate-binding protein [Lachnospiraceae bacterium]